MSSTLRRIVVNHTVSQMSALDWCGHACLFFYLLLAPIVVFLPPVSVAGTNINVLRFLGGLICIIAIASLFFPATRMTLRIGVFYLLTFLYSLLLLSLEPITLIGNIKANFGVIMFFAFTILLIRTPCDKIVRWFYVIIAATFIAFFVSLGVRVGLIGTPSYRSEFAEVFALSRTAKVSDSAIGIWCLIASLYIVAEQRGWKCCLGYAGIIASFGIVMLGQFRSYLICCIFILMVAIWFRSFKRIRIPLICLAMLSSFFIVLNLDSLANTSLWKRFDNLSQYQTSYSLKWRSMERQVEIDLIKQKPLNGHGWGVAREHRIGSRGAGWRPIHGHCLYTALPVRIGMPLAMIFLSSILMLLFLALRSCWNKRFSTSRNIYLASLFAVGSLLMISFVQNIPFMTITFPALAIFVWPLLRPLETTQKNHYSVDSLRFLRRATSWDNRGISPST